MNHYNNGEDAVIFHSTGIQVCIWNSKNGGATIIVHQATPTKESKGSSSTLWINIIIIMGKPFIQGG